MQYRTLGRSGLVVSAVGLGCNNLGRRVDLDGTRALLDAAQDVGLTLLDTADIYGGDGRSEELLGQALAGRRDDFVVATKFGHQRYDMGYGPAAGAKGSRAYVRRAVEASLRRLSTDHVDLYQLHTPDPLTPVEETVAALDELVTAGLVRYVGASNLAGWQLADADHVARAAGRARFVSVQNEWSLLERGIEDEVVPAAQRFGVGVLPYFPLANGLLTGKVTADGTAPAGSRLAEADRAGYLTAARLAATERVRAWSDENGRTLLETAIGWLLAHPVVSSVIAGATSPDQLRANAAAADAALSPEQVDAVSELTGA